MRHLLRITSVPRFRISILAILVLASIGLLVSVVLKSDGIISIGAHDFTQYYAATRLLLHQQNPYDAALLLEAERAVGWIENEPLLMWNPPWVLALVSLLALLPFRVAAWCWLFVNTALALASGALLWHELAPPGDKRYWIGLVMAVAYVPTLQTINLGQLSLWPLFGIAGFLYFTRLRQDFWAGTSLALLFLKPHLTLLFLVSVAWWVFVTHRWRCMLGMLVALLSASAIVASISPGIFTQYFIAAKQPPLYWHTTTMGNWLRVLFGPEEYWLQFFPTITGLILLVIWLFRHRTSVVCWQTTLPWLLISSTVCAVYGWSYDFVTLIPVVIVMIVRLTGIPSLNRIAILLIYVISQIAMFLLNLDMSYYFWFPLVLTGLFGWQTLTLVRSGYLACLRSTNA